MTLGHYTWHERGITLKDDEMIIDFISLDDTVALKITKSGEVLIDTGVKLDTRSASDETGTLFNIITWNGDNKKSMPFLVEKFEFLPGLKIKYRKLKGNGEDENEKIYLENLSKTEEYRVVF